jgi:hypothetical protein
VKRLAVIGALAALAAAGSGVGMSSAAFTAHSAAKATITAASDWVGPSVSISSPSDGAYLRSGTATVTGSAGADNGDSSVVVSLYSGANATGTPIFTRTVGRVGTSWSTPLSSLADGTYTLVATQADAGGNTGRATRTFTVDSTAPTRVSVTTTNGADGTVGRLEAGDVITYTYSEAIAPASILTGFTGAATAVKVRFLNQTTTDGFTVLDANSQANVKLDAGTPSNPGVSLGLGVNYVSNTVTFNGTMTQSTDGRSFTIVLGSNDNPSRVSSIAAGTSRLTWTPKTGPTDLAGNALANTNTYTETTAVRHF